MGCAIQTTLPPRQILHDARNQGHYVAAVLASTGNCAAKPSPSIAAGRTATADGTLVDGKGRLVAHGSTHLLILDVSRRQA